MGADSSSSGSDSDEPVNNSNQYVSDHAGDSRFPLRVGHDDREAEELFVKNQAWRKRALEINPNVFDKFAHGQAPRYLWIGCSDSRVPPDTFTGLPPGSLFVHRNIANCVNGHDMSVMSVIQYAVEVLEVQHVVVCGHYECGGVNAALTLKDHTAPLENWLRGIRDVHRLHRKELEKIDSLEERRRRMVELNVIEQSINVFKTRAVQKRRVQTFERLGKDYEFVQPRVHPCVYDPLTGELKRLDVDMRELLEELIPIYSLYHTTDFDEDSAEEDISWEGMGPSWTPPS